MKTAHGIGILLCIASSVVLTGCTTYIAQPGPPTVSVPPPQVIVEPPRIYVPPPPVYVAPVAVQVPAIEIRTEVDFYEPLSAHGRWEVIGPHGRCWVPS